MSSPSRPPRGPDRPIALAGFMGAGKTTVGRIIARRLNWDFVDADARLEARTGRSIDDFFASGEEAEFRRLEAEVVAELVDRGRVVIALGGGALMNAGTRALLARRALLVHLDVSWTDLRARFGSLSETRPLLRGRALGEVQELYRRRIPDYRSAALSVPAAGPPEAVAEAVLAALGIRQ